MVDIIVPVYNVLPYLRECLDSILNQTYKDIHLIVIDDGSTDGCSVVCDKYSHHPQVTVLHQENSGQAAARNSGLALATAPYIMFVDSDDWIEPDTVEILMKALVENEADIACGRTYMEYSAKTIAPAIELGRTFIYNQEQALDAVFSKTIIGYAPWGKLYKRKAFEDISFPLGKNHEDIPVTPKVLLNCQKVVVVDKLLFHYRQQEGSLSRGMYNASHRDLYDFSRNNRYVIEIYPSLTDAYWASYYTSLKDLLTLFMTKDCQNTYSEDYHLYKNELREGFSRILRNKRLNVKAKISILSILLPFRKTLKNLIMHRR